MSNHEEIMIASAAMNKRELRQYMLMKLATWQLVLIKLIDDFDEHDKMERVNLLLEMEDLLFDLMQGESSV